MLFSFDQFTALNRLLGGLWRLILLNLLWTGVTLLGLGVLGLGPASYALARYLDRWIRHGETPPTVRTFWRDAREQLPASTAMGALLLGAGAVIGVNLLSLTDWYLRAANHLALGVLLLIGGFVFAVMASTEVRGVRRRISAALLLGLGSLHRTILGAAAVILLELLMARFAVALLPLLGAVLPALAVALILRPVLTELAEPAEPTTDEPRALAPVPS